MAKIINQYHTAFKTKYADKNRTLLFLQQIESTIDWQTVKELLMKYYQTGKASEDERAYPSLLLFKCFLLGESGCSDK